MYAMKHLQVTTSNQYLKLVLGTADAGLLLLPKLLRLDDVGHVNFTRKTLLQSDEKFLHNIYSRKPTITNNETWQQLLVMFGTT